MWPVWTRANWKIIPQGLLPKMAGWGWILYLQKYIWVQKRRRPLCGTSTKLVQNGQPALLTMTFMWLQIGIRQPVPPEISLSWKKKQRFVTILQKNTKRGCLHFWGSSIREEASIIWWQPPKNSQTIWCLSRSKTPATIWCLSVQRNGLIDWVGSALHKFQWKVSAEKCSSTFYFFSAQKTIALSYMSNMRNLRWWCSDRTPVVNMMRHCFWHEGLHNFTIKQGSCRN